MPFSSSQITHSFLNSDLTPASGTVEFSLTKRITNGTQTLVPSSLNASLNASGNLSQSLTSNVDPATSPVDSQWRVDLRILGASVETFYITVPVGPGTVDLGTLLQQQPLGG
ncbi:MAG: hypothetical protein NVS3B1_23660 [Marmoricola sp.]